MKSHKLRAGVIVLVFGSMVTGAGAVQAAQIITSGVEIQGQRVSVPPVSIPPVPPEPPELPVPVPMPGPIKQSLQSLEGVLDPVVNQLLACVGAGARATFAATICPD